MSQSNKKKEFKDRLAGCTCNGVSQHKRHQEARLALAVNVPISALAEVRQIFANNGDSLDEYYKQDRFNANRYWLRLTEAERHEELKYFGIYCPVHDKKK